MSPATMNPGFISTADQLQFDAPLDASLVDLITNGAEYKKLVASGSPSRTDRLRVAVADLTGKKLCNPGYAGWGSTVRMMGTSSAKIAILYAAHQLIFDLDQLARSKGLTTEAALRTEAALAWSAFACPPDHHWLAAVDGSASPVGVAMSPALQRHLEEMVDARFSSISTGRATDLVLRVGFEYIASVLWQSGLRHPTRGGLWFPNTYQSGASTVATQRLCHRGNNPVKWKSDPLRETGIAITALSAVTFMTLLAQLRLADQSHSRAMESLLSRGCVWADVPVGARIRATKCGIAAGFQHGVLLVQDDKVRYALAYLTKDASWRESTHERFMRDIHQLVRANNP